MSVVKLLRHTKNCTFLSVRTITDNHHRIRHTMNNPLPSSVQAIIFIFGSVMFSVAFCSPVTGGQPQQTPTNVISTKEGSVKQPHCLSVIDEEKLCEMPTAVAIPVVMCNKSTKPFDAQQTYVENDMQRDYANPNNENNVLLYKSAIRHAETLVTKTVSTKRSKGIPQMGFKRINFEEPNNIPNDSCNAVLGQYMQLFG